MAPSSHGAAPSYLARHRIPEVPTDLATGSRLVPPNDTDYGMREFALVDPSGNLLRIGSDPSA